MTLTILLALALCSPALNAFSHTEVSGSDISSPRNNESTVPVLSSFPSELTVDGLVSLAGGRYAIQMGAFTRRSYAEALCKRIGDMTGLKLDLIEEAGWFKVFINGSLRGEAPCLYIPISFPGEGIPRRSAPGREAAANAKESPAGVPENPAKTRPDILQESAATTESAEAMSVPAARIIPANELTVSSGGNDTVSVYPSGDQPIERNLRNLFF
ncbi:MAG: SPOR domain-containing protein [Bacteroidales bacterium]